MPTVEKLIGVGVTRFQFHFVSYENSAKLISGEKAKTQLLIVIDKRFILRLLNDSNHGRSHAVQL